MTRNGSRKYNLQHLMTQECGDVWLHAEISTDFYNVIEQLSLSLIFALFLSYCIRENVVITIGNDER